MELRRCIRWLAPVVLVALSATSVSARHAEINVRPGGGSHFRAGHPQVGFDYFRSGLKHRSYDVHLRFGTDSRVRHYGYYPGPFGFSDRHYRLDQRRRDFIFHTRPFVRGRPVFTSRVLSPVFYPSYYPYHYFDPYFVYTPPPPVIIIDGDREADERRDSEEYYPDPERRDQDESLRDEPRTREGVSVLLTRHLRIETVEAGVYRIQWTGAVTDLAGVSYRSLGEGGRTLDSVHPTEPPFQGLLRVPEETMTVEVTIRNTRGGSAVLNLPTAEFRRLVERVRGPGD